MPKNYRILSAAGIAEKVHLNYQRIYTVYTKSIAKIILVDVFLPPTYLLHGDNGQRKNIA